jgi:hypothetical protein
VGELRAAGLEVYATLAPILPCDPEQLAALAVAATDRDVIGDPFHVRSTKPHGAITFEPAERLSDRHGFAESHDPIFQSRVVDQIRRRVEKAGRRFVVGPAGFSLLSSV